ncbi:MAG: aromatic ring-hydroxylating dioxygenase subunit alpha [Novosphingobium sp.]|nr:aromatic ring-hydroxylating dioxygenase subunit alpha [Novosphingobium sp.]
MANFMDRAGELSQEFIPSTDWVGDDVPRLEREKLWPKVWQVACREEEIPNIGDFVNYEIDEESFLIVRVSVDEIRAFYNVCSHRGRRLKTAWNGNVANGIMCRFHAWRFDLEGKVTYIPNEEGWEGCQMPDRESLSLIQPRVDTWGGAVWLTMNPDSPPLREYLSPAADKLDPFDLQDCRTLWYKVLHVPADWKLVLEAFIEAYHTEGTHPQLERWGSSSGAGDLQQGIHSTHGSFTLVPCDDLDPRERWHGRMKDLADTLYSMFLEPCMAASERVLTLPPESTDADVFANYWKWHREEMEARGQKWPENLTPADMASTAWQIFPNTSILPTIDGGLWYRFRPDPAKPGHSIMDIWALARFAPGEEPRPSREVFPTLESFKGQCPFLEQDFENLLAVQKGTRSRVWKGANINPREETTVYHFHKAMHDYLSKDG